MNSQQIPITFKNSNGLNLFGILHLPELVSREEAIILLSPGIKNRVAPHRLYVKMANAYVDKGFPTLRFDYYGLGDSEGEIDQTFTADLYGSIETGRYVDDTICAMNWLKSEHGIKKFILGGLCGGAITGLLTSVKDTRVVAILGLALPIVLSSSNVVYDEFLTTPELKRKRSFYIKKLMTFEAWRSWVRFLTFKSDYKLIFRSLFISKLKIKEYESEGKQEVKTQSIINPHFMPAFKKAIALQRKFLIIFAEADRHYWQFSENLIKTNLVDFDSQPNIDLHVIKNANHIFSFKNWQKELLEISENWLYKKFRAESL